MKFLRKHCITLINLLLILALAASLVVSTLFPHESTAAKVEECFIPYEKRINVNNADMRHLQLLPGIGETMAHRIVEEREQNGPYLTSHDLLRVKGIGEKTLQKILPYVVLYEHDTRQ